MPAPPFTLDSLRSFLAVAEELNFRRAADRLAVDQSALTRRIQKLEADLGVALFERTTRAVSTTEAGRLLQIRAARLLAEAGDAAEATRSAARGETGRLRIAYMAFAATELMPAALRSFRETQPGVSVALSYMPTQAQKAALARDEVDLGFLVGPFAHPEFEVATLRAERLCVLGRPDHPLLAGADPSPGDVAAAPLALGDLTEWEAYRQRLDELFAAEGAPLRPEWETANSLALLGLVAAGLGVTVFPESAARFLGRGLAIRPIADERFRVATALAWRRSNRAAPVRRFATLAKAAAAM